MRAVVTVARVFPSRTKATPRDALAFVGDPPKVLLAEISRVLVSVTFSWDIEEGRRLQKVWSRIAPTEIGGPAFVDRGGLFISGQFLAPGYVITSRGCPNHCWFCAVPRREGGIRELPIVDGWNVLDSNLLACSPEHQERVFQMLARQPRRPEFTGGLDPGRVSMDIARRLREIKTNRLYCAYDTPDDLQNLVGAGILLQHAGFTRTHHLHAYVLCGWANDTFAAAEKRFRQAWSAGFMPMAMPWRNPDSGEELSLEWRKFARLWARPAITRKLLASGPKSL